MAPYTSTSTTLVQNKNTFEENPDSVRTTKRLREDSNLGFEKGKFLFWEFETPLIWPNIIGIVLLHLYAVYSFVTFPLFENPGLVICGLLLGLLGGFGVTGGAHRYWTHKTYKAKLPLRIILLFCFSMTGQNSLKDWVRDHRVHHKFSETDADPHNSRRGFFFAHVGWLMMRKHPEVTEKGQKIDCDDIFEDPLVVYHQRYFMLLKLLCCFILPTIIPPLVWGESWYLTFQALAVVRYTLGLNFTWSVNSAAHLWGYKPYDKNICPVENVTVSLIALGEGYHNYHHTFPWDYRAAEFGKSFNITTYLLDIFQKIGWAYDMKTTPIELLKKVIENNGDGTHYKWGHEVPEENAKVIKKIL